MAEKGATRSAMAFGQHRQPERVIQPVAGLELYIIAGAGERRDRRFYGGMVAGQPLANPDGAAKNGIVPRRDRTPLV